MSELTGDERCIPVPKPATGWVLFWRFVPDWRAWRVSRSGARAWSHGCVLFVHLGWREQRERREHLTARRSNAQGARGAKQPPRCLDAPGCGWDGRLFCFQRRCELPAPGATRCGLSLGRGRARCKVPKVWHSHPNIAARSHPGPPPRTELRPLPFLSPSMRSPMAWPADGEAIKSSWAKCLPQLV